MRTAAAAEYGRSILLVLLQLISLPHPVRPDAWPVYIRIFGAVGNRVFYPPHQSEHFVCKRALWRAQAASGLSCAVLSNMPALCESEEYNEFADMLCASLDI